MRGAREKLVGTIALSGVDCGNGNNNWSAGAAVETKMQFASHGNVKYSHDIRVAFV